MMNDLVEKWAIKLALGNNGGTWAEHYNEDQKNHWRNLTREFMNEIAESGYKSDLQLDVEEYYDRVKWS